MDFWYNQNYYYSVMILKSLDWEKSMKLMPRFLAALFALALTGLALAQNDEITYNTHVAQIINENCVVCHREGGIGPMQFENYDQVLHGHRSSSLRWQTEKCLPTPTITA